MSQAIKISVSTLEDVMGSQVVADFRKLEVDLAKYQAEFNSREKQQIIGWELYLETLAAGPQITGWIMMADADGKYTGNGSDFFYSNRDKRWYTCG